MLDLNKEREAFNENFGLPESDDFFLGETSPEQNKLMLKCHWLGWKKRAEFEYRENPETIEINGLETIHKLCKFADEHNMEGCTFTEIVERMFDELAKAQAIPEGFVLVPKEPTEKMNKAGLQEYRKVIGVGQDDIRYIYKAMIEARESAK